jgi:hypothetical protein
MQQQTWKEFKSRNASLRRQKVLDTLNEFGVRNGFVVWHDNRAKSDPRCNPKAKTHKVFFRTRFIEEWLRKHGVSTTEFLKAYGPLRMNSAKKKTRRRKASSPGRSQTERVHAVAAVPATAPVRKDASRTLKSLRSILDINDIDELKLAVVQVLLG